MARVERRGGARGGLGQTGVVPGSDRLRRPAGCIVCASPPCRVRPMPHVLYLLPPEGPRPPLDHTRYARRQKFRAAAAAAASSSPCFFPARCDAFIRGRFPLSFYVSPGRGSTNPDSCGNEYHTSSCGNITRFARAQGIGLRRRPAVQDGLWMRRNNVLRETSRIFRSNTSARMRLVDKD